MRKSFLTLFIYFFYTHAISQTWEPMTNDKFDKKEIKDSSYKSVYATRYYYDYNQPPEWADSFYLARFDSAGRIILEKSNFGIGDSIINEYSYGASNMVTKNTYRNGKHTENEIARYNTDGLILSSTMNKRVKNGFKKIMSDTFYYDKGMRLVRRLSSTDYYTGVDSYFYDKNSRLEKLTSERSDSFNSVSFYSYNESDSLVQIRLIETWGARTDSVFYRYAYDNKKRLIEKSRQPSKTYYKTLDLDCSSGDFYCYQYDYDSLNRIIYESDREYEIRGETLAYASVIYTITTYNEYGYAKQSYDLHNKPSFASQYNKFEYADHYGHFLRESNDATSVLTTYLSQKSKLKKTIDLQGPETPKSTIIYIYYK